MGSFPETCIDPLECYLLKLTKIELCNVAKFYSRLYGGSGGGGGGGHVSAPHHTNVRKVSRFCGAISILSF